MVHGSTTDACLENSILISVVLDRSQEFPPKSALDPSKYGDHTSTITAAHIEKNLEGLTVQKVI
jgi:linoleate 9S-lipoxygenase